MDTLVDRLSPTQLVTVISIICGAILGLVLILAITKYQLQALTADTDLKRERQQAELGLKEKLVGNANTPDEGLAAMLRLDVISPGESSNLNVKLAKAFGLMNVGNDLIEDTMGRALLLEDGQKRIVLEIIDDLFAEGAEHFSILAAVRPFCQPPVTRNAATPSPTAPPIHLE